MAGLMKIAMDLASATIGRFIEIEPNKPLHHHWAFWWPIVVFGSLSCYVGFKTNDFALEYLVSPKVTMDALSYPLFVLSFALPIVLAVGRFHASAQRAETIRISESTMSFKHYYDHREAFVKYMEGYNQKFSGVVVSLQSPITLYEVFYPNASMELFDIVPCSKTSERIQEALGYANSKLLALQDWHVAGLFTGNFPQFSKLGIDVCFELDALSKQLEDFSGIGHIYITAPFLDEIRYILEFANEFDRHHNRLDEKSLEAIDKHLGDKEQYRDINVILAERVIQLAKDKSIFSKSPLTAPL